MRCLALFDLLDGFANDECEIENIAMRVAAHYKWNNSPEMIDACLARYEKILTYENKQLIQKWKKNISGRFMLIKHCDDYAIFYSLSTEQYYAVKALNDSFYDMLKTYRPVVIDTILFAYNDLIVWDGLAKLVSEDVDTDMIDTLRAWAGDAAIRGDIVMQL